MSTKCVQVNVLSRFKMPCKKATKPKVEKLQPKEQKNGWLQKLEAKTPRIIKECLKVAIGERTVMDHRSKSQIGSSLFGKQDQDILNGTQRKG